MKLEKHCLFALMALAALLPLMVSDQYLLHIAIMVLFYAVLASSLNLVVGYVGEFSLGHTAFWEPEPTLRPYSQHSTVGPSGPPSLQQVYWQH
jgi:hypothetical protein